MMMIMMVHMKIKKLIQSLVNYWVSKIYIFIKRENSYNSLFIDMENKTSYIIYICMCWFTHTHKHTAHTTPPHPFSFQI
jgi:hypothetical protein